MQKTTSNTHPYWPALYGCNYPYQRGRMWAGDNKACGYSDKTRDQRCNGCFYKHKTEAEIKADLGPGGEIFKPADKVVTWADGYGDDHPDNN